MLLIVSLAASHAHHAEPCADAATLGHEAGAGTGTAWAPGIGDSEGRCGIAQGGLVGGIPVDFGAGSPLFPHAWRLVDLGWGCTGVGQ